MSSRPQSHAQSGCGLTLSVTGVNYHQSFGFLLHALKNKMRETTRVSPTFNLELGRG